MQPQPPEAVAAVFVGLWAFLLLTGVLGTIFWIVELIDVARREFPDPNTKILWLLVVILSHGIGALLYYFIGKRQGYIPGTGGVGQNPVWQRPPYQ